MAKYAADTDADFVALSGDIEGELAGMDPEDRVEFQEDLGITEPGLERLAHQAYNLLGLQTYFTVGPKEARAWTITRGTLAPQAAGVIHGDFERGFIAAEVVHYDDLVALGSKNAAKEAGKLRIEGKEYVVKDGDVIEFGEPSLGGDRDRVVDACQKSDEREPAFERRIAETPKKRVRRMFHATFASEGLETRAGVPEGLDGLFHRRQGANRRRGARDRMGPTHAAGGEESRLLESLEEPRTEEPAERQDHQRVRVHPLGDEIEHGDRVPAVLDAAAALHRDLTTTAGKHSAAYLLIITTTTLCIILLRSV